MDIRIDAPGHKNFTHLKTYLLEKIQKRYSKYDFITVVETKLTTENGLMNVNLQVHPKKGPILFAKDSNEDENKAVNSVMKKMHLQIQKYKDAHFNRRKRM